MSYQDLGRVGPNSWLNFGVAPAGAIDAHSASLANRLVHNLHSDTVIEIMLGGAEIEMTSDCWLAHTGACACAALPSNSARLVRSGELLRFNPSPAGVWSYLAIAGGWQAASYFGSTSRHQRSDIGQTIETSSPLYAQLAQPPAAKHSRTLPSDLLRDFQNPPPIRLHPGPHLSLFTPQQWQQLLSGTWTISPRSDRTGYRLTGDSAIPHQHSIHSTPTLLGSIQIPPNGQPIVTLHDGPTVGGYPLIARVHPDDLPWIVQQHAHQSIRFQPA